jgi:hypothetical protein
VAQVHAGGDAGADESPDEAMLEFIVEWQDEQGRWQDPLRYEDPGWQVVDEDTGQSDE